MSENIHPYSIRWNAPLFGTSGYAEEARNAILALQASGFYVTACEIGNEHHDLTLSSETKRLMVAAIMRSPTPPYVAVHHKYDPDFSIDRRATHNIWRTMIETDTLPDLWVQKCNELDACWVPSQLTADSFTRSGVMSDRISVVPQSVDIKRWSPSGPTLAINEDCRFIFLSIFRWSLRKGWDILLRAYVEEFVDEENVILIIKSAPAFSECPNEIPSPPMRQQFEHFLESLSNESSGRIPRITLLDKWMSFHEIPSLMRTADCYVMPSRGEAWGRPLMEAMACELPVIGTGWGGNLEFMSTENSYLIDYELVTVSDRAAAELSLLGGRWAEPDVLHLRTLMRSVFEDREKAREMARIGRASVLANCSRDALAKAIHEAVARLRSWNEII